MSEKELIALAIQFIKTDEGQKVIGTDLDVNNLDSAEDDSTKGLTPEQLEDRDKEYTPQIEKFNISGRLFDKTSNEPLSKAKISPILATGEPVQTDNQGQFTITLGIPILPYNQKALVQSQLLATANNFVPTTLEVLTSEKMVKTDIKTKGLININKAAQYAADELRKEIQSNIDKAKNIALSIPDKVVVVRRNSIYKMTNTILFKLLPLAIGLLVIFGITKIADLKKAICPTPEQLLQATRRRNRLVRQLNQIYIMVAVNTALAALFTYISVQLRGVKLQIQNLPLPLGLPPGAPPYALISNLEEVKKVLDKFIEDNKKLNRQLLIALIFLVAALIILLMILRAIDQLVLECAPGTELEEINQELRNLENEAEANAVTPTNQINGFTIEVETVDQNAVGDYKRRQAVGKNPQGIVLVKGDPSFSAEDTVLINELAFFIQSNNLKAY
tara:strand:+ start:144 stop:1484 length:1341 start_codon:yes stop_codon:yes gene_type:complete